MYGIENLKKSVLFLAKLTNELGEMLEDGKVSFMETIGLTDNLISLPALIESRDQLKLEILDLTEPERIELNEYLADNLKISKGKAEQYIEVSFDTLTALAVIFNKVKVIRNS